jgi:hypothetical protein
LRKSPRRGNRPVFHKKAETGTNSLTVNHLRRLHKVLFKVL